MQRIGVFDVNCVRLTFLISVDQVIRITLTC